MKCTLPTSATRGIRMSRLGFDLWSRGRTRITQPLGVVNGKLFMTVDKDAPNRKIIAAPVATPEAEHWTTVIPEGTMPIQDASLVAGQLGLLSLQDVCLGSEALHA